MFTTYVGGLLYGFVLGIVLGICIVKIAQVKRETKDMEEEMYRIDRQIRAHYALETLMILEEGAR